MLQSVSDVGAAVVGIFIFAGFIGIVCVVAMALEPLIEWIGIRWAYRKKLEVPFLKAWIWGTVILMTAFALLPLLAGR